MNLSIRNTCFQDAVFVRLKAQNSLRLPQALQKTPKLSKKIPEFDHPSFLKSLLTFQKGSFIEKLKSSKFKPSKEQINTWMYKKQTEVRSMIQELKNFDEMKAVLGKDEIILRPKEQTIRKRNSIFENLTKKKKLSTCSKYSKSNFISQSFSAFDSRNRIKSLSLQKLKNRVYLTQFEHLQESHQKIDKKMMRTPISLNRRSTNRELNKQSISNSFSINRADLRISDSQMIQTQTHSLKRHQKQRIKKEDLFQQSYTMKFSEQKKIQDENFAYQQVSMSPKSFKSETQKRPFKSALYSTLSYSPVKKYTNRQLSPNEQKNLVDKYSKLQNRLDKILKATVIQRQRTL